MIKRLYEKGRAGPGFINAGVYLLEESVFAGWEMPQAFSLESDFFVPHLLELAPRAFTAAGRFIDIGVPADYEQAQRMFEHGV